jgi:arylsulfatase A-like enzyme
MSEQPAVRRNIVFVLVDDLRYDAMGFLRPPLDTPNIDRLAREGAYFKNAFVTSSLCSPSRATMLTGLSMRNHGIVDNNKATEDGFIYFSKYLQDAGYQTGFFGKWHFGAPTDAPRPGFDRWVSFAGQGSYFPTTYLSKRDIAAGKTHRLNVDGERVPQQGYITDELTDYALDWLDNGRDESKPFFLYLSHKAVHSMAIPPARYADQYAGVEFEIPASAAAGWENDAGKPLWVVNQRNSWHGVDFVYHTGQKINDYMRDYYRTLSPVDDSLGRILRWLDDMGQAENTTVIFSSDNGYMEGEHGLIDKRNAYEESMRIPLLLYAPGVVDAGTVVENSVTSLDFAPTFLDCAGVPPPPQFEGRSILPLATGALSPEQWDEDVFYEYYWEWNFPMTPTTFAIRTRDFKYIQYHGVWDTEELYDLQNDPAEMRNLIDDERYADVKVDLRRRMYEGLTDQNGQHVIPYNARVNAGIIFRRRDGSKAAEFPEHWHRDTGAPDLMDGLIPDSPFKTQLAKAGKLPLLWAGPHERGDGSQSVEKGADYEA